MCTVQVAAESRWIREHKDKMTFIQRFAGPQSYNNNNTTISSLSSGKDENLFLTDPLSKISIAIVAFCPFSLMITALCIEPVCRIWILCCPEPGEIKCKNDFKLKLLYVFKGFADTPTHTGYRFNSYSFQSVTFSDLTPQTFSLLWFELTAHVRSCFML